MRMKLYIVLSFMNLNLKKFLEQTNFTNTSKLNKYAFYTNVSFVIIKFAPYTAIVIAKYLLPFP